jgi:hypothetical protein
VATYHVANIAGAGVDWTTIAQVNAATFQPDDFILFNKGDTWRETLTVPSSGSAGHPITFGAYGSGANPILTGATPVATWTEETTVMSWQTAFTWTANQYREDSQQRNYRVELPANISSYSGTKVRVTVKGKQTSAISGMSIGAATANDDFTGAPTRVTFGGENTKALTAEQTVVSDEVTFTFTKTSRHLIHTFSSDSDFYGVSAYGGSTYYDANGDETTTQSVTMDNGGGGSYGPLKIEVLSDVALTNLWKATLTTEPQTVWFGNVKGTKVTSAENVDSAYEWFWSANVLYVYSTADPDIANNIETGARANVVTIDSKNYITFQDLTFEHADNNANVPVTGTSRNIVFDGITSRYAAYSGILFYQTSDTQGTVVKNSSIYGNGQNGIYYLQTTGGSGSNLNYAQNNLLYSNNNYGFKGHINYCIIENNTVHDNGTRSGTDIGIWVGGNGVGGGTGDYNIIRNNLVYNQKGTTSPDNDGAGITLDQYADNNQVYNNIVYNCDGSGIYAFDSLNFKIYHNTCYKNNQNSPYQQGEIRVTGILDRVTGEIKNNIGYSKTGAYAIYLDADSAGNDITITNNNWFIDSGNWYYDGSAGGATLATWNTKSYVGTDLNSDPLLISASNFHLQSASPCKDTGTSAVSSIVTKDFDGVSRPQNFLYDIGAYEYIAGGTSSSSSSSSSKSSSSSSSKSSSSSSSSKSSSSSSSKSSSSSSSKSSSSSSSKSSSSSSSRSSSSSSSKSSSSSSSKSSSSSSSKSSSSSSSSSLPSSSSSSSKSSSSSSSKSSSSSSSKSSSSSSSRSSSSSSSQSSSSSSSSLSSSSSSSSKSSSSSSSSSSLSSSSSSSLSSSSSSCKSSSSSSSCRSSSSSKSSSSSSSCSSSSSLSSSSSSQFGFIMTYRYNSFIYPIINRNSLLPILEG